MAAGTDQQAAASDTRARAAPEQVARLYQRLVATYGIPPWTPDGDALGGLVATVLSQHTSDVNSTRAYAQLRQRFATWEAVRDAPVAALEDAIRIGGLAARKAVRIQRILRALSQRAAGAEREAAAPVPLAQALDGLRALPLDDALAALRALPGVGPKTAACVLLFSLGQPAFPVDTHVWRVTKRLGLIAKQTTAEAAHAELTRLFPPEWRHTLHVDLIQHGRQMCHARNPACVSCPLRAECQYYWDFVASER
ncbi:MAG: endonuclease III domain-containing protein [Ktedonobacterales bacterium]